MITVKIGDSVKIKNDIDPGISGEIVRIVIPGPCDVDKISFDESAPISQDPMFTLWAKVSPEDFEKLKTQPAPQFNFNTLPELPNTVISVKNKGLVI